MQTDNTSQNIVLAFLNAMNAEDFEKAKSFTTDDLYFNGVMGKRNGAEAYFNDMKKMLLKYDVQKVFAEGDDVCILYNISMQGKNIFTVGIYHVENNKIKTIQVVFDPRPLL